MVGLDWLCLVEHLLIHGVKELTGGNLGGGGESSGGHT